MLSEEQMQVVESSSACLSVQAYAGAGKTTTLRAFAAHHAKSRVLYIAYNKSVAQEAKGKMPPNVDALTSHALAMREMRRLYSADKLTQSPRFDFFREVVQANAKSALPPQQAQRAIARAASALQEQMRLFCCFPHHTIEDHFKDLTDEQAEMMAGCSRSLFLRCFEHAWRGMTDPGDPAPLGHEGYFKAWQLSRPRLGYDIVLVDEAQDTNQALFDVLLQQDHARRVLVGDPYQNIYGFRETVNALRLIGQFVPGTQNLYLTRSHRFGPAIANVASGILREFASESRALQGAAQHPSEFSASRLDPSLPTAMLFRTNMELLKTADVLAQQGASFAVLGSIDQYRVDLIDALYGVFCGREVKNRSIIDADWRRLRDWKSLLEQIDEGIVGPETKMAADMIEQWRHSTPQRLQRMRDRCQENAPLLLTTAHKSKGAEFDQVVLAEDFVPLWDAKGRKRRVGGASEEGMPGMLTQQEVNLWYVAATRARKRLVAKELAALA